MKIMKLKWIVTDRQDDPLLAERLELLEVEIKLIIWGKWLELDLLAEVSGSDSPSCQVSMEQNCKHMNSTGHLTV